MLSKIQSGLKKFFAGFTLLSFEVVVLLILFLSALAAFLYVAKMVFRDKKSVFDDAAFQFLSLHISNRNTDVMQFFTFLGTHTFLIPANILLVLYFLFINKHRWYSIKVPVVALSSLLLMFSLKFVFHRNRPLTPLMKEAMGFSFPSGHALISSTFYGLLIYIVWQNVKNKFLKWLLMIIFLLLIFLIGLSRVYLRVHYASDVIAGFCIGIMWLLLALWILSKIEKFSGKKVDPVVQQNK